MAPRPPASDEAPNPKVVSSDYRAMLPYWKMVSAILHGVEALRTAGAGDFGTSAVPGPAIPYENLAQLTRGSARISGMGTANQSPYLPQLVNELNVDYEIRRKNAPLTNIYKDISENLSAKPFSKTCELAPDTPQDLIDWSENVDGQGNNLHVFASQYFKNGINKGIDWILVDYVNAPQVRTLADERAMGAKPYWVHVAADNLLAIYSDFVAGREVITHARIYELSTRRVGFREERVEQVREFTREAIIDATGKVVNYKPATWQLWELVEDPESKEKDWTVIESGAISIGIIPLIPFKTGARDGCSWQIQPPLQDLAHMQIEEFQQESNKRTIKEMTAFPMLSGDGVARPTDNKGAPVVISVGPRVVLFTGTHGDTSRPGSFKYVEPSGASLNFLKTDLEGFRQEMRDLGKQPLASANLTVVTTANVSMRASSSVQAWALLLKDALEQAMIVTAKWLGRDEQPVVNVHTDFNVELQPGVELDALLKAEAQSVVSKETVAEEFKRRGVLMDDRTLEEEKKRLAEQQAAMPPIPIDPRTGKPLSPQTVDPLTGKIIPKPGVTPPQLTAFTGKAN